MKSGSLDPMYGVMTLSPERPPGGKVKGCVCLYPSVLLEPADLQPVVVRWTSLCSLSATQHHSINVVPVRPGRVCCILYKGHYDSAADVVGVNREENVGLNLSMREGHESKPGSLIYK